MDSEIVRRAEHARTYEELFALEESCTDEETRQRVADITRSFYHREEARAGMI